MATFRHVSDPLVSCPINPVHRMKKSTLQMHLTKCRKDNVMEEFKQCPFNAQHVIKCNNYMEHITKCPDRAIVDRQVARTDTEFKGATSVPDYNKTNITFQSSEPYWDADLKDRRAPGYDPKKMLTNQNQHFKDYSHIKPAERRKMYQDLHLQNGMVEKPTEVEAPFMHPKLALSQACLPAQEPRQLILTNNEPRQPKEEPIIFKDNIPIFPGEFDPESRDKAQTARRTRLAANFGGRFNDLEKNERAEEVLVKTGKGRGILGFCPSTHLNSRGLNNLDFKMLNDNA